MTFQNQVMRRITTISVVAALTCVVSLAAPTFDPAISSPDDAGNALWLSCKHKPDVPSTVTGGGRATPMLLKSYPVFDNWNLDTAIVRDSTGLIHFGNRLWEYSDQNPNYDRFVFDTSGQLVETHLDWAGLGGFPAGTDTAGNNFYVKHIGATQQFGVIDGANNIHLFTTSMEETGWEIKYAKLDRNGNPLIGWTVITVGAHTWNWYVQPVVTSDDTVIITWMRNASDICAARSYDGGVTWSDTTVLFPNAGLDQAMGVKTVVGLDDSLHFVWRTLNWDTEVEKLWYAKVRSDWTVAVDETPFYVGAAWYPYPSMDDQGSLHVTFAPLYDTATDMYYTRLRGDLDLNGASATDAQLTAIPEMRFYSDPRYVHYPLNQVDENGMVHVAYEVGNYGRQTNKYLYYVALCTLAGDLNCSEVVDIDDLAIFEAVFAGPDVPTTPGSDPTDFARADMAGGGYVDLADFAAFQLTGGTSIE